MDPLAAFPSIPETWRETVAAGTADEDVLEMSENRSRRPCVGKCEESQWRRLRGAAKLRNGGGPAQIAMEEGDISLRSALGQRFRAFLKA